MNLLFVLCNQHDQFYTKSGEWNNGDDNRALYRSPHKDEAINQMVEITVKHPEQRIRVVEAAQNERGLLQLPFSAKDGAVTETVTAEASESDTITAVQTPATTEQASEVL